MKSSLAILAIVLRFGLAARTFSIDKVKSINCTDSVPTATTDVYFTTDDAAAKYFLRWMGSIPYDYGNLRSPEHKSRSGQMTIDMSSDYANGKAKLIDFYSSGGPSSLVLIPTTNSPTAYRGFLSGDVQVNGQWAAIHAHPMLCNVIPFAQ